MITDKLVNALLESAMASLALLERLEARWTARSSASCGGGASVPCRWPVSRKRRGIGRADGARVVYRKRRVFPLIDRLAE
ncbi:MAG: hypothetical protein KKC76_18625 [Proteobacteria bacterium]|nr:hypothetical protein [Pseudomonadota bacterium]MBU4295224.1 hypothetical protein [Pseudomonadota bacterium]MCG2750158.1 hypothetical protein [Desulfobulbaceae bacterium]